MVNDNRNSLESFCRKIASGFAWDKTAWHDREYLRLMVKDVLSNGHRESLDDLYDIREYVLLPRSQKTWWVSKQDPSLNINFVGSHLLNGKKYYFGYAYES
jgi:hypothetical protein|tara:strand:+ start:8924 stop:9226 length:303 start_codon:yes stop_codon:yes gene_type:complete